MLERILREALVFSRCSMDTSVHLYVLHLKFFRICICDKYLAGVQWTCVVRGICICRKDAVVVINV